MLTPSPDSLQELEGLLSGLGRAVERRSLGEALTEACNRLDTLRPRLDRDLELEPVLPLLSTQLQGVQRDTVEARLNSLRGLGTRTCEAETREQLSQLIREFPQVTEWLKEIERILEEAWRKRVEQEFNPTSALGKVLKEIKDTADLGAEMTKVAGEAARLARGLPRSAQQRESFAKALEDRNSASILLEHTGAERVVVEFLQAVADEKATLAHVNSAVAAWLSTHGAAERFKVIL